MSTALGTSSLGGVAFALPLAAIVVIAASVRGISTGLDKVVSTKMNKIQTKLEGVKDKLGQVNL